jgi:hypothetical protein
LQYKQNLFLFRCWWSCLRPETYHHEHSTIMCVCNPILPPYVKVCKTSTLNREYQETYSWQGVSRNLLFTGSIKKPTLDWEFHRSFRYNCPVLPHHTHLVVALVCFLLVSFCVYLSSIDVFLLVSFCVYLSSINVLHIGIVLCLFIKH